MSTFLALDDPIQQRIEEALENAGFPPKCLIPLTGFLQRIGSEIYRGCWAFFKLDELCRRTHYCEKTVRTWLSILDKANILSRRRAGPKGIKVQLQPDFLRVRACSKQSLDPRREQAIDQRLLEMGDRVESPEAFRQSLRQKMTEQEIDAALARREGAFCPAPRASAVVEERGEVLSEDSPEAPCEHEETPAVSAAEILEAAAWRVKEKEKTPGFTGFLQGARSYLEATRRQIARFPDQVRAILERKKAAEARIRAEAEKRRRIAEIAAETAARARQEKARQRALLKTFAERPEEEQRGLREQAESSLPRNIRRLRANHPARVEQLERQLLSLLEPKASSMPLRDLGAELALRLSKRPRGSR